MPSLLCPHNCGVTFNVNQQIVRKVDLCREHVGAAGGNWFVNAMQCPTCEGLTVELILQAQPMTTHGVTTDGEVKEQHRVWPRSHRKAAPAVPADLARDFGEASAVLDLSPRASAAMSRRCLQQVLTHHVGATGPNFEKQIDSVSSTIPSQIASDLHALRHIGNFGAHPIKDKLTGDIVDVEPGEAEWSIEVLDGLFDFVFVAPEKQKARKADLNKKLQAAGKPQVPLEPMKAAASQTAP